MHATPKHQHHLHHKQHKNQHPHDQTIPNTNHHLPQPHIRVVRHQPMHQTRHHIPQTTPQNLNNHNTQTHQQNQHHRQPINNLPIEGHLTIPTIIQVRAQPTNTANQNHLQPSQTIPNQPKKHQTHNHTQLLRHRDLTNPNTTNTNQYHRINQHHHRHHLQHIKHQSKPKRLDTLLHNQQKHEHLQTTQPSTHTQNQTKPKQNTNTIHTTPRTTNKP